MKGYLRVGCETGRSLLNALRLDLQVRVLALGKVSQDYCCGTVKTVGSRRRVFVEETKEGENSLLGPRGRNPSF